MAGMVVVITIGAISMSLAIVSSHRRSTQERTRAVDAAASVLESMQGLAFEEVFARYNATVLDDPATGSSPGQAFSVTGLNPVPGDPDGIVGLVLFPGDGVELREDLVDSGLGTPRDLSADGVVDSADHAVDYTILPIVIEVQWLGASGEQGLRITSTLSRQ